MELADFRPIAVFTVGASLYRSKESTTDKRELSVKGAPNEDETFHF